MLLVIAVIAMLIAVALPAIQQARESARRVQCKNNLRQLALALQTYHDRLGSFPPSTVVDQNDFGWWSWTVRVLPDLEQSSLYARFDLRDDVWSNCYQYRPYTSRRLPFLICPSDPNGGQVFHSADDALEGGAFALTNYFGCRGSTTRLVLATSNQPASQSAGNGVFPDINRTVRIEDILDGTGTTILAGERPADSSGQLGWWAAGIGADERGLGDQVLDVSPTFNQGDGRGADDTIRYWSFHPGGAHFAMCDGSVRFLAYSIDQRAFLALGSRNKGDIANNF